MEYKQKTEDEIYEFLLSLHENYDDSEIEYRVKLDNSIIKNLLVNMKSKWSKLAELEQSVNFVYKENRRTIIERYLFTSTTKFKKDSYEKEKILDAASEYSNIKITGSREIPSTEKLTNLNIIRIKNRLMVQDGIYRFDITQVATISKSEFEFNKQTVKTNRTKIFSNLIDYSGDQLYDRFIANMDSSCNYELEIEIQPNVKEDLDIQNIIDKVPYLFPVLEQSKILARVKEVLDNKSSNISIKTLTSKAVTISKNIYNETIYPPVDYFITNKADGDRALLYIKDKKAIIIASDFVDSFSVTIEEETILDCELIKKTILIFDAIMVLGKLVTNLTLKDRIKEYEKVTIKSSYDIVFKEYVHITEDLKSSFKKIEDLPFKYPQDGFILSDNKNSYSSTNHYKIKKRNTIDFLALELPSQLAKNTNFTKKPGFALYILFCGISKYKLENLDIKKLEGYDYFFPDKTAVPSRMRALNEYLPIQFSPADNPKAYLWYVDKKTEAELNKNKGLASDENKKRWVIVELEAVFNKEGFEWKFYGIRNDRINEPNYFGNDFSATAENNWIISQDPLKISEMHTPVESYFAQGKQSIYMSQTAAISISKTQIIQDIFLKQKNGYVMDLASGKGQDLHRYIEAGFNKGLFLEYDRVALATLLNRRYNMMKYNKAFKTYIGARDLTEPADKLIDSVKVFIEEGKPDFINCNLALHYLIPDTKHLVNICKFISSVIADKGYFAYTSFNGNSIVNLLKGKKEWKSMEGEVEKYHIIKMYETDTLTGFGQNIKVKLPFGKYYEESLINHDLVDKTLEKFEFKKISSGSMLDFYENYPRDIKSNLTDEDKKYVSLYGYHIYKFR